MGNENEGSKKESLVNQLTKYNQYYLPQYGGKVVVDTLKKTVTKTLSIEYDQEVQFSNLIRKRMQLSHPNLGKFLDFQILTDQKDAFCGYEPKIFCLKYQLLAYSLFNEIQSYCKIKQPIPQGQICRIFQSVVNCLDYLKSQNTLHGDIKVGSIFMDKHKTVKLVDSFFLKYGRTNFQIILQDPKSMSFLAPEQLQLLRIKLYDSLELAMKHQIFMVGLSMIQTTTIKEGMRCYNLESLTINEQFFIHAMKDIQYCGYSFELSDLIMNCVHKNPSKRPTFRQFLTSIGRIKNIQYQKMNLKNSLYIRKY